MNLAEYSWNFISSFPSFKREKYTHRYTTTDEAIDTNTYNEIKHLVFYKRKLSIQQDVF